MQGGEVLRTDARTFLKLYVHGILFSLLSTVLSLGWVFVAAFLIRFGFLVGLAIAIGLLVLLAGFANAMVSRLLWFPVKGGLWVYFQQGLIMSVVVVLVLLLIAGVSFLFSPVGGLVAGFRGWRTSFGSPPLDVGSLRPPCGARTFRCRQPDRRRRPSNATSSARRAGPDTTSFRTALPGARKTARRFAGRAQRVEALPNPAYVGSPKVR